VQLVLVILIGRYVIKHNNKKTLMKSKKVVLAKREIRRVQDLEMLYSPRQYAVRWSAMVRNQTRTVSKQYAPDD